ncbi:hypothetical protein BDZ97DRAFT_2012252 [Flammula alnicola]|nr:hypothetical protein BDZ97DRAFT_2012252 [Flammula alnicola]
MYVHCPPLAALGLGQHERSPWVAVHRDLVLELPKTYLNALPLKELSSIPRDLTRCLTAKKGARRTLSISPRVNTLPFNLNAIKNLPNFKSEGFSGQLLHFRNCSGRRTHAYPKIPPLYGRPPVYCWLLRAINLAAHRTPKHKYARCCTLKAHLVQRQCKLGHPTVKVVLNYRRYQIANQNSGWARGGFYYYTQGLLEGLNGWEPIIKLLTHGPWDMGMRSCRGPSGHQDTGEEKEKTFQNLVVGAAACLLGALFRSRHKSVKVSQNLRKMGSRKAKSRKPADAPKYDFQKDNLS